MHILWRQTRNEVICHLSGMRIRPRPQLQESIRSSCGLSSNSEAINSPLLALGNGGYTRKEIDKRDREVVGTIHDGSNHDEKTVAAATHYPVRIYTVEVVGSATSLAPQQAGTLWKIVSSALIRLFSGGTRRNTKSIGDARTRGGGPFAFGKCKRCKMQPLPCQPRPLIYQP